MRPLTLRYSWCASPPSIYGHAPPIYYKPDNGNTSEYMIIARRYENEAVLMYDIHKNEFLKKFQYPSTCNFKPTDHINALNTATNELYVFGGFYSVFGLLNLNTHHWTITLSDGIKTDHKTQQIKSSLNIDEYRLCYPYFIGSELHVFHRGRHLMYSADKKRFRLLSFNNNKFTKYGKLCYVPHLNSSLMLFGGDCPMQCDSSSKHENNDNLNIWCYETRNKSSSHSPAWKLLEVALEFTLDLHLCHVVLAYEYIVILFDLQRNRISCLDLFLTKRWYPSSLTLPAIYCRLNDVHSIKTENNSVHFLRCKAKRGFHIKFDLLQCVPMNLRRVYEKRYELFTMGYLRIKVEKEYDLNVPLAIKHLLNSYFPAFL